MVPASKSRLLRWLIGLIACLAAGVGLAWFDYLPGGWTLRGLIEPHHLREAREQAERSRARLAEFDRENDGVPPGTVVFLGSSTIERFPLESAFPGIACLDRGIGNETATELLERLDRSLPDAPQAGAVLYLASLDFRREHQPPEVIRRRAGRVVAELRLRYPGLPITLLGILPEQDMPAEMVAALAEANDALAALCREQGLSFVPSARPPLALPGGSLAPGYAADRLHLNEAGYRVLTSWLLAEGGEVARLLKGGG